MSWTLKYHNASNTLQTVTFPALAALEGGRVVSDGWTVTFQSHKASTVKLRLPGVPPHVAPAIPFESRIQIIDPSGTIQFQGFRTDRTGTADPHKASSSYQFDDEWYFLDHCAYQQQWVRSTSNVPFPNVVLFQPNPGQTYSPAPVAGLINTGQQIKDILSWAISMGANLQVGQITPALYQAWYPIQNVKCGDALRHCLRLHPDCFTEIDYTTTPPTFNVRQRSTSTGAAYLTPVTLPYAYTDSNGRRHTATEMQPRPELQPSRVALFYRVISSNYLLSTPVDIYPSSNLSVQGPVIEGQSVGGASAPYTAGGTPVKGTAMTGITGTGVMTIPVGAPGGLRALDFAIDLQGPKMTMSTASITSAVFNATDLSWWQRKIPSLTVGIPATGTGALQLLSSAINSGGAMDITVKDDTGAPIDLSVYSWELLPQSSPMAWMKSSTGAALAVIEATVTAHFTYTKQKTIGTGTLNTSAPNDHVHHVRVKLCNSASITSTFSQYITTGEAAPANLAQNIYNSLATLQYSFSHTMVEKPFNGWLKPGKHAINLGGTEAAAAWTTMNATLQQSEYKMHLDGGGNTFDNFTVKCGPVEHLEPGQLIQLFNVFANRDLTKIDTNERLSGSPSPGNNVVFPDDTAQENSVPAVPDHALQVFSAPDTLDTTRTIAVQHDPANGTLKVQQLKSADGTQYTTGTIGPTYTGTGAPSATTLATGAYYRQYDRYLDTAANQEYICTTAGYKTASIWSLLTGGGGGGAVWI